MEPALRQKLDQLPAEPGCYLMKDRAGKVVYVGKASSLRARVRSYFDAGRGDERAFVALLEGLLGDLDVIVTRSEKEAVLLENELIKKHRPRFNVRLRDDKDFIVLRLGGEHPYPRLEARRARERRDDGARYFGPYSSASSIRETLRIVNRWFQLRTCTDRVFSHRTRPCVLHQIGRCPAPCVRDVPREEYQQSVQDAISFLEGREDALTQRLRRRMEDAARERRFEDAARWRDQLIAVERSLEKQRVLMSDDADRDAVGLHREGPDIAVAVLAMRGGRVQEVRTYPFSGQEFPDEETLSSFLALYYEQNGAPDEILLPLEPEGRTALEEVLSDRRGRKVKLVTPQRGAKADLLDVAARNAAQAFENWHDREKRRDEALAAVTRALHLAREPRWLECYDISTFQGTLAVGSGVSVKDGEPDRANYRRYKIRGVAGQDDFAMLHEVMTRRLRRALAEGSYPDLLVIDGGKGQLQAALAAARDLGVSTKPVPGSPDVPFVEMVALAKSRLVEQGTARVVSSRRSRVAATLEDGERSSRGYVQELERTPERVFLPGRKDPIVLRQNSAELFLLARARDEAHRFAIEFHRKLRRGRALRSILQEIPGVGPGRRRALLSALGSMKRVREASIQELSSVEGIGPKAAETIWGFFHGAEAPPSEEPMEGVTESELDRALDEE